MIKDLLPWKKSQKNGISVKREDALSNLYQHINDLFDSYLSPTSSEFLSESFSNLSPRVDVSESDDALEINAELPGMEPKDIDVSIDGDFLVIKGEKKEEHKDKNKNYHVTERRYGSFSRMLEIPVDRLDLDKIESKFKKGVLHLKMPKTAEAKSQQRKIAISS